MRALRLLVVLAVLAAGLAAAWPFRHRPPAAPERPPQVVVDLPLRRPDIALAAGPAGSPSPASGLSDIGDSQPQGGLPSSEYPPANLGALAPPPALSADFGPLASTQPHERHVWQPVRMKLPLGPAAMRRHRITDGDSLERLAERYLGDATRAGEIFEANRDLLSAPDILPLGRILRIPPREAPDDVLTAGQ